MPDAPVPPQPTASPFRAPVLVLAMLTVVAGFSDGYALTRFDVFVANQSGNVVRIGMGLVGAYSAWDLALLSMIGFACGGMVSWLLNRIATRHDWPLIRLRLVTILVFVALWWLVVTLLPARDVRGLVTAFLGAAAMGVLATVLTKVAGVRTQPTYQSANVLSSAQGLLDWITHADPVNHSGRKLAILGSLTLLCYALGGAAGAVAARGLGTGALLLVILPLAVALLLAHIEGRRAAH